MPDEMEAPGGVAGTLTFDAARLPERIEAIRPLVPDTGHIPFIVLPGASAGGSGCVTCGEASPTWRCPLCAEAIWHVMREKREVLRRLTGEHALDPAQALHDAAHRRGIELYVEAGALKYRDPGRALNDVLHAALRTYRAELIAFLEQPVPF